MKHFIIGFTGLILVFTAGPVMAEKPQNQNLSRAVIKINNLPCGGCFASMNEGLAPLEGYSGMGANLFRKLIAVDFEAPLTAEKIFGKLIEIGYSGNLETVDAISEKESFAYIEYRRTGLAAGGGCCSSGGPPLNTGTNESSSNQIAPSGGSCCTAPGVSQ